MLLASGRSLHTQRVFLGIGLVGFVAASACGQVRTRADLPKQLQARTFQPSAPATIVRSAINQHRTGNPVIHSRFGPSACRPGGSAYSHGFSGPRPSPGPYVRVGPRSGTGCGPYVDVRRYSCRYPYVYPYPAFVSSYSILPSWYTYGAGSYWSPSYSWYPPLVYSDPGPWIDDGYRYERYEGAKEVSRKRSKGLLSKQQVLMSDGLRAFEAGRYEQALSLFRLATGLNTYDPAARIHAAHAAFSVRRYSEAVRWLRSAFDLEPRLVDLPYDVRDDYGNREDFNDHLAALKAAIAASPNENDLLILLGYIHFYSDRRGEAARVLRQVADRRPKNAPKDELVSILLDRSEPEKR